MRRLISAFVVRTQQNLDFIRRGPLSLTMLGLYVYSTSPHLFFYPFNLMDSNGYNAFTGRDGNSLAPELAPSKPTDQNPHCF